MGIHIVYHDYARCITKFPPELKKDIEAIKKPLETFSEVANVVLRCQFLEDDNEEWLELSLYTTDGKFVKRLGDLGIGSHITKYKHILSYSVKSSIGVTIIAKLFQKYGILEDYKITGTGMYDGDIEDLYTTVETFLINNKLI